MRQGGLKPKGHNSGVYWVRATGKTGGGKTKKKLGEANEANEEEQQPFDSNGDGRADFWGVLNFIMLSGVVIGGFGYLIWLNYT